MPEYIEREAVYKLLKSASMPWGQRWEDYTRDITRAVEKIPAADVRPERHGGWEFGKFDGIGYPVWCTACGIRFGRVTSPAAWLKYPEHQYCGNCGAKMDGKDGENNDSH